MSRADTISGHKLIRVRNRTFFTAYSSIEFLSPGSHSARLAGNFQLRLS